LYRPDPPLGAALDTAAQRQLEFVAAHGHFAASMRDLGWAPAEPGLRVVVLSADSTGWSAIAVSLGVPDYACVIAEGRAVLPVATDSVGDRRACGHRSDFRRMPLLRVDTIAGRTPRERNPEERCPPLHLTPVGRAQVHSRQTVILRFILDTLGHPEPDNVTLKGGDDFNATLIALEMLSHCSFAPATLASRPVRVMIDIPMIMNP
jgi:hypothetical protein